MTKNFKWLVRNGKILLLRRTVSLFGEGWECFGCFDDKNGNASRAKQIVKQLNECARHTENFNKDD